MQFNADSNWTAVRPIVEEVSSPMREPAFGMDFPTSMGTLYHCTIAPRAQSQSACDLQDHGPLQCGNSHCEADFHSRRHLETQNLRYWQQCENHQLPWGWPCSSHGQTFSMRFQCKTTVGSFQHTVLMNAPVKMQYCTGNGTPPFPAHD